MEFVLYKNRTPWKTTIEIETLDELLDYIENNFERKSVIISIKRKKDQHVLYAWTPYDKWVMQEYTGVWLWWTQ